jgi:CTP synthase
VPFFGICYGLHMAVIEVARDLAGLEGAGSTEISKPKHPVIALLTEWTKGNAIELRNDKSDMGGTMRLGAYPAVLKPGSHVAQIYGTNEISERHRHRYEVNTTYTKQLAEHGLVVSGWSPDGRLPEIMEIPDHPWFIGVQFHPELKSKPLSPHPLFASFIDAAVHQSRLV